MLIPIWTFMVFCFQLMDFKNMCVCPRAIYYASFEHSVGAISESRPVRSRESEFPPTGKGMLLHIFLNSGDKFFVSRFLRQT